MLHPEVMRQLAKDRQQAYEDEARRARLARESRSSSSSRGEERRDRFDVRSLRWLLLRPSGA